MNPASDSCWLNMRRPGCVSDRHDIVVKLWGNVGLEARDVERSRVDLIPGGNDVAHAENHRAPFEPNWRKMTPLDPLANGRSMDTNAYAMSLTEASPLRRAPRRLPLSSK